MTTQEMSRMEIELNSMDTTSDGSPVVTGNENEQKSITALNELLEQELKDDSVDCFIKRVGDPSENSSEFGLNYDEAPIVSSSAFYSPPKDTSTDNNSLLEKELEDTLNKSKEETLTSDTDKLQSGEEETTKDDTPVTNTSVEDTDEGTKEIKDKGEDDNPDKNDSDSEQNQDEETDSEVKDLVDKKDSAAEDATKERETGDEVPDSTEVKLPSEVPNSDTKQTEKGTNNESAKAESTKEVQKDALYLVFHPKDKVNNKNDSGKDNESKVTVQCSETSTTSDSVVKSDTGPDKPVTKAVLSIPASNEAKNDQEINKAIIVKKTSSKIIKGGNAVTTKPADACEVTDCTSVEGSLSSTKSSEPEEKSQNESDDTKGEESEKHDNGAADVKTGRPKPITTRKVYGNSKSKKIPKKTQVPNTEDEDATNMNTQDHHSNADHDKTTLLGNGVKSRAHIDNEGETLPDKLKVKEGDESTEKRKANFGSLKRKFEEICRISREEEDVAIKEIKKMKKETLDVLKKINAEMEKLKLVFLAGK